MPGLHTYLLIVEGFGMNDNVKDKLLEYFMLVLGIVVVIGVGWIVLNSQIAAVQKLCEELVTNGTINNISECNITMRAI